MEILWYQPGPDLIALEWVGPYPFCQDDVAHERNFFPKQLTLLCLQLQPSLSLVVQYPCHVVRCKHQNIIQVYQAFLPHNCSNIASALINPNGITLNSHNPPLGGLLPVRLVRLDLPISCQCPDCKSSGHLPKCSNSLRCEVARRHLPSWPG